MSLRKPLAGATAVAAALAIAVPATSASAATAPTRQIPIGGPPTVTCPLCYGLSNPATGCDPWWLYFENAFFAPGVGF
jgi:hypothetical protein